MGCFESKTKNQKSKNITQHNHNQGYMSMHSSGDYQKYQNMSCPPHLQQPYPGQYPPQNYPPQQGQRHYSGYSSPSQYDKFMRQPIVGRNHPFPP